MLSNDINPLQNIFTDVSIILDFIETKNLPLATSSETESQRSLANAWLNAYSENDSYLSYARFWEYWMFQEVIYTTSYNNIMFWMEYPGNVPIEYRDNLLIRGREAFLSSYEEPNNYYRKLTGLPNIDASQDSYIQLSDDFCNEYEVPLNTYAHELNDSLQNAFLLSDEYGEIDFTDPSNDYLKYIGKYKIDLYTARTAKDFEIIRYPDNTFNVNQYVLNEFQSLYTRYREYVKRILYNDKLENVFDAYRSFMQLLLYQYTLMQLANSCIDTVNTFKFMDNSMIYMLLSMYDIPTSPVLTDSIRKSLALNVLMLTQEKGTNVVYSRILDILGYNNVTVNKLIMMKGQKFNEIGDACNEYVPYFIEMPLKCDDVYKSIVTDSPNHYTYNEIIDNDPTWWDLDDTRDMLLNSDYSMMDTKYITLHADITQSEQSIESVYFPRMIFDYKKYTNDFYITIPDIFGTKEVSLYNIMIFMIAASNIIDGFTGVFFDDDNELLSIAGFNNAINTNELNEYLASTSHIDIDKVSEFIKNITMSEINDISRVYNDVLIPMRSWMIDIITTSTNREEVNEYIKLYKSLYTYDILRNSLTDDHIMPIDLICNDYDISSNDMKAFTYFYPHTISGNAITVDEYYTSNYPIIFLSPLYKVTWYIDVIYEDQYGDNERGILYFYDILNSDNCMDITNPNGTKIFMDYNDGWEINITAVNSAISAISELSDNELSKAYFAVQTFIPNSGGISYDEGEMLPSSIRIDMFKTILIEKLTHDMNGLHTAPTSYIEYLSRYDTDLYNLLVEDNRFSENIDAWTSDISTIILAFETYINTHLKYLELSILGKDTFFQPLQALINRFKSTFTRIALTSITYMICDKIDIGGNLNMIKIFDEIEVVMQFVILAENGYDVHVGLYDVISSYKMGIKINDKKDYTNNKYNKAVHMSDDCIIYKNGIIIN